jgi:hypothetical protein
MPITIKQADLASMRLAGNCQAALGASSTPQRSMSVTELPAKLSVFDTDFVFDPGSHAAVLAPNRPSKTPFCRLTLDPFGALSCVPTQAYARALSAG